MNHDPRIIAIKSLIPEVNLVVYLYLIRAERIAIVDTGIAVAPRDHISPALNEYGLTLADIDYILNTHGHYDHTGGNAAIKAAGKAQIIVHADEAAAMENRKLYLEQFYAPMVDGIMGKGHIDEHWGPYHLAGGAEVSVDQTVKDNDIIDLGGGCTVRAIHLPGHTPGSLGFYLEQEGILFTGDSLPGLHEDNGALPIISDLEAYKRSVKRLMQMPIRAIMASHYHRGIATAPSHIKQGEEVKQYLSHCFEAAEAIDEAIRSVAPYASGKPIWKVYDEVVGRLPKRLHFKPISQIETPLPVFCAWVIYFTLRQEQLATFSFSR